MPLESSIEANNQTHGFSLSQSFMDCVNWCRKHEPEIMAAAFAVGAVCLSGKAKLVSGAVIESEALVGGALKTEGLAGGALKAEALAPGALKTAGASSLASRCEGLAALTSRTEAIAGKSAFDIFAEKAISHVPTTGAFAREFAAADGAVCNKIARATGMGQEFYPAWNNWVLETPQHGVVGYASTYGKCFSDLAVLPQFRGDTRLLTEQVLTHMKAQGGKWFGNAKLATGLPYLRRLDKAGMIKILGEPQMLSSGATGLNHVKFEVL